jgi:hypothetical protein
MARLEWKRHSIQPHATAHRTVEVGAGTVELVDERAVA